MGSVMRPPGNWCVGTAERNIIKQNKIMCENIKTNKIDLIDFIRWWNNLPDDSDDRLYMTEETANRFLKNSEIKK